MTACLICRSEAPEDRSKLCHTCKSRLYYWQAKTPKEQKEGGVRCLIQARTIIAARDGLKALLDYDAA